MLQPLDVSSQHPGASARPALPKDFCPRVAKSARRAIFAQPHRYLSIFLKGEALCGDRSPSAGLGCCSFVTVFPSALFSPVISLSESSEGAGDFHSTKGIELPPSPCCPPSLWAGHLSAPRGRGFSVPTSSCGP